MTLDLDAIKDRRIRFGALNFDDADDLITEVERLQAMEQARISGARSLAGAHNDARDLAITTARTLNEWKAVATDLAYELGIRTGHIDGTTTLQDAVDVLARYNRLTRGAP